MELLDLPRASCAVQELWQNAAAASEVPLHVLPKPAQLFKIGCVVIDSKLWSEGLPTRTAFAYVTS